MKKSILFLLLIFSISVFAQSFSFGPQIGFLKTTDADNSKLSPSLAARLSLLNLTVESSIGYKEEEFEDGAIKTKSYPVNLTGMIGILPIINLEAGIGWHNTTIEYFKSLSSLSSITKSKPAYHLGVGAELPLGNLIFTGDIRYVFIDLDLNHDLTLFNIPNIKSNYYVLLVGVMFKL